MAEIGKSEGKSVGLGMIFLLILLAVFIVWVFTGGPSGKTETIKTKTVEKSTWPPTSEIPSYGQVENN
jgi:hypothetical protein